MSKVVFIDVDGTLTTYEGEILESTKEAIKIARERGHKVYICTGRSRAEIYEEIWAIGLDGLIGGNGSYIESDNKVIYHKTLSLDECKRVVDWLKSRNLEYYLECNSGLYGSENFIEVGNPVMKEYRHRKNGDDYESFGVKEAFPDMIFNKDLYRDDVNKISFILNTYDDYLECKNHFKEFEVNTWGGSNEKALFGDVGVKDIDKAKAVKILLDYLNVDVKDTLAIGDAKIDISMLEYCNIGIAMASGGEEIKNIADYITDGTYDDGIYKAFKKFNLI